MNHTAAEKRLSTSLDLIPFGDEVSRNDLTSSGSGKKLPEGITSRMIYRDVVKIAWPSFVELILTQLASMVDMMMVGSLGAWALAAVGLTIQPKFLMIAICQAMNVGTTALIARYKGAGNMEKANMVLRQSLLLTFVLSVFASLTGYIFAEPMIQFMGAADARTLAGGVVYLRIQMVGFIFMALTGTITAGLRGVGDSRTAMIYNLIANIINVIFNYLLIYGHFGFPKMEIAGASLATIIGQFIAFLMAGWVILRGKGILRFRFQDGLKPDMITLQNIFHIGFPALVEQVLMRVGLIIYSKTVANLGTIAFATHQVCMNVQALSFMNGMAFAVSATTLMGQSLGKRRTDMAQAYCIRTQRVGTAVSLILGLCFAFFGEQLVGLYNSEPEIIRLGGRIMILMALMQPLQSSQFIIAGGLRGAGDTRATAFITFITVLLVRPAAAVLLINFMHWGVEGAWVAMALDQIIRSVLVYGRYRSGKWKTIRMKHE